MRSLLRCTVLTALVLVACWGIPGCSSETQTDTGKMGGPVGKMDTGETGGPMDKMEGAIDKGKMKGAMDKSKMEGAIDKGKVDAAPK